MRRRVVLPEPLRPRMAVVDPSSSVREIPSSKRLPPGNAKETLWNAIAGVGAGFGAGTVKSNLLISIYERERQVLRLHRLHKAQPVWLLMNKDMETE